MNFFDLVGGILLLLAGRKLFWLCAGITGFLVGTSYALYGISQSNTGIEVLLAIAFGILLAVLAFSFQWITVVIAIGFLGGGYLLSGVFPLPFEGGQNSWLLFVMGGIAGMLLIIVTFDWALILISSLLGATLMARFFNVTEMSHDAVFIISMMVGVFVQCMTLKDSNTKDSNTQKAEG